MTLQQINRKIRYMSRTDIAAWVFDLIKGSGYAEGYKQGHQDSEDFWIP